MTDEYDRLVIDYQPYRERQVEALVAEASEESEDDSIQPGDADDEPTDEDAGS